MTQTDPAVAMPLDPSRLLLCLCANDAFPFPHRGKCAPRINTCPTRLLDMGIEPYLVASSVEAILAQRLVRVICPDCREVDQLDPEVAMAVKSLARPDAFPTGWRGRGCSKRRFTGYRGRTVITELMVLSDRIRELTVSRRHANEIDAEARREGMTSLFFSGLLKARQGMTTYEEILKATKGSVLAE